ncbi:NAD(P)H-binding protein [Lysinibacillus sp. NPDC096418]|uniref:NAD(P)H-binding protein n=1 Tax=Lysinibacillus sp. NPDC096418 TaxID=3364138 RepID=UPI00380DFF05
METTKRIAIVGGTGKVGRHIAAKAVQNGYQVRMLVRNPEKITYKDNRIEVVIGDIQNIDTIRTLLKDCQSVINTFGQPIKETPIYSKVTDNILEVMDEFEIERYIGVTGGSLTINGDKKSFMNRVGAKLFEILYSKMMLDKKNEWLILQQNKQINWTLFRLPFIKESLEIANVKVSLVDMPGTKITNQDIATYIINQIKDHKYIHQAPFISN